MESEAHINQQANRHSRIAEFGIGVGEVAATVGLVALGYASLISIKAAEFAALIFMFSPVPAIQSVEHFKNAFSK